MKIITLDNLQAFKTKLDGLFVAKEKKTGSTTEYKVLSDNNLTNELVERINSASSSSVGYKIKGSIASISSLPAPALSEVGNVYNINSDFVTPATFLEGTGKAYPAGSNVVCVEASSGVFRWDVLGGFVDTTAFAKKSEFEQVTNADIDNMFA